MRRFFIEPGAVSGKEAILTGPEVKHIRQVLRLEPGSQVSLFDGTGTIFLAKLKEISKSRVVASVIEKKQHLERPPFLHLAQGLIKKKNMELITQKATELGVASIRPFHSQHGSINYQPDSQHERWQRIALEACKQCDRPLPPICHKATDFKGILSQPADLKLFCWEKETGGGLESVQGQLTKNATDSVLLLIGPEGGFNHGEAKKAEECGFLPITLGSLTLRAETASLAAISIVQYLLGKMSLERENTPLG